jgi:hypothetical protein
MQPVAPANPNGDDVRAWASSKPDQEERAGAQRTNRNSRTHTFRFARRAPARTGDNSHLFTCSPRACSRSDAARSEGANCRCEAARRCQAEHDRGKTENQQLPRTALQYISSLHVSLLEMLGRVMPARRICDEPFGYRSWNLTNRLAAGPSSSLAAGEARDVGTMQCEKDGVIDRRHAPDGPTGAKKSCEVS